VLESVGDEVPRRCLLDEIVDRLGGGEEGDGVEEYRWSAVDHVMGLDQRPVRGCDSAHLRRDHVERIIRPALERGAWVVCDRFADSTRAYQGAAGGVDPAFIAAMETYVLEHTRPDLTLIFDMPVDVGLQRAHERAGSEMRFESKGLAFHERLREGFLAIARAEPDRCAIVDASGTLDDVEAAVWAAIESRLAVHV